MTDDELATFTRLSSRRAELRFERELSHPAEKVWHALTDPAEQQHWFPCRIEGELVPGAQLRFVFPKGEMDDTTGEVLTVEPPRLLVLRWDTDVLRFDLTPDEDGCRLVFTHTVDADAAAGGIEAAARTSAGWDGCLHLLSGRLDGRDATTSMDDWSARNEAYVDRFGLGEGTVLDAGDEGWVLRFDRDLVAPVGEAWATLLDDDVPVVGQAPPLRATNEYVDAGALTDVAPGKVLAYAWRHDGTDAGAVRWELHDQAFGSRLSLEVTVPSGLAEVRPVALAAWQTHLELFAAAVQGRPRPWDHARTEALRQTYAQRLS